MRTNALSLILAIAAMPSGSAADAEIVMQVPASSALVEIAVSRDGEFFATGGTTSQINLHRTETGALLKAVAEIGDQVTGLDFDLAGEALFVMWHSGLVSKLDIATGEAVWEQRLDITGGGTAALSPDGSTLAVGSGQHGNNLFLLDPSNGSTLRVCDGHRSKIKAIAFSPDGTLVATGSESLGACRVTHVVDGSTQSEFTIEGAEQCLGLTFSPDGTKIAATFGKAGGATWDIRTGQTSPIPGLADWARGLRYDTGGDHLLVCEAQGLRQYRVSDWEPAPGFAGNRAGSYTLERLPDDSYLVGRSSGEIDRWSASGELLYTISAQPGNRLGRVISICSDHNGETIALLDEFGALWAWSKRGAALNFRLQSDDGRSKFTAIALAPDGGQIIVGDQQGNVRAIDSKTGTTREETDTGTPVHSICYSNDGKLFAALSVDASIPSFGVGVWSTTDNRRVAHSEPQSGSALEIQLEDGGARVFVSTVTSIKTWRPESGEWSDFATGSPWTFIDLAPDGLRLAAVGAGDNGWAKVWDTASGQELWAREWKDRGHTDVLFTPDGEGLIIAKKYGGFALWEPDTGQLRRAFPTSGKQRPQLATAQGWVATAGPRTPIHFWNMESGAIDQELRVLPGDEWLAHSPDRLYFNGSPGGIAMAGIRFGASLDQIYPLAEYNDELQNPGFLADRTEPAAEVRPRKFAHWWANVPHKGTIALGLLATLSTVLLVVEILRRFRNSAIARQEAFARRMIEAQEADRQKIAAEIHDSLGQNLLIIKTQTDLVKKELPKGDALRQRLENVSAHTSETIEEARNLAYDLRPYQLDRLGLTRALKGAITKLDDSVEFDISQEIGEVDEVLERDDEIGVFRIIQECLNNVVKHAAAKVARVFVDIVDGAFTVEVSDDGKGFDAKADYAGFGLANLRERVRLLGGEFTVQSSPSTGTKLAITVPVHNG